MAVQWTAYTVPLAGASVLLWAVTAALIRHRRREAVPGIGLATAMVGCIALVLTFYVLELSVVGHDPKVAFNALQYVGLAPSSAFLLAYVLVYIGRGDLLTRRTVVLLFAPAVLIVLTVVTNDLHQSFWTATHLETGGRWPILRNDHGVAYFGFILYTSANTVGAIALLGRAAHDVSRPHRALIAAMLVGSGLPLAGGLAYAMGFPGPTFPPLSYLAFVVTAVVFAWPVFRHDLFTVVPIANRTLVGQIDEGVVASDASGTVVTANSGAGAILGIDPETLVGREVGSLQDVLPAETDELRDGDVVTLGDRIVEVSVAPMTQSGHDAGELVLLADVTDWHERENRLRRQNELLDEFASVVSHDIATPLSVIEQRARLIEMSGEDEHAESMLAATDRIRRLMDDLLDLARQGKRIESTEPVELEAAVLEAWRPISGGGVSLTVESSHTIEASRSRLCQLLENLLGNAREHARTPDTTGDRPDGAIDPTDTAGSVARGDSASRSSDVLPGSDDDGDRVRVTVGTLSDGFFVADDGPGIPEADRDVVFEQGHSTVAGGTGLGLAIVHRIADTHGWTVSVTDAESGGARFEIRDVDVVES